MTKERSGNSLSEHEGQGYSPLFVILSGPSGVGKDAVLAHMRHLGRPYHFVVTATTRAKRAGEQDGVHYFFISPDQFLEMMDRGAFLENAQVYGNWYGVPRSQVKEAFDKGVDVLVKTDVQGAATLKREVPEGVYLFLAPPSIMELEQRLRQRKTESTEDLALRIQTARKEMSDLSMFDYVVINYNGHLEETVARVEAIITAEKCRVRPRRVTL